MNTHYRSEYMRNIYKYCKEHNLKLKVETINVDIGFLMEHPAIGCIGKKECKKLKNNIKEAVTSKTIVCYFCPQTMLVLMNDNYINVRYSHPFKNLENWFNNQIGFDEKTECAICLEEDYFKAYCETCFNWMCSKCHDKMETCPFCRDDLITNRVTIQKV